MNHPHPFAPSIAIAPPPRLAGLLRSLVPPFSGLRPATASERSLLLDGDEGFVIERGGSLVAHCGFRETDGVFYAHSLLNWGTVHDGAQIVQKIRNVARARGYDYLRFDVWAPHLEMLRLVGPRVSIESAVLRMAVRS